VNSQVILPQLMAIQNEALFSLRD